MSAAFFSRDGACFRVQWECRVGDSADDSCPVKIDVHIPFTQVRVLYSQEDKITLEEAKQIVGKRFDLNDLEELVPGWGKGIIFKVKEKSE